MTLQKHIFLIFQPLLKNIKRIEKKLEAVIFQHFNIEEYNKEDITRADKIALVTEARDVMAKPPHPWNEHKIYEPLQKRIIPLNPEDAEALFLERYGKIKKPK